MQKTTKTNFKKILKLVLWAGLIIFCINLIIKYPVHRHIGFDRMYKYMDMQKIPRSDIKSVRAFRSTKTDDYVYWVVLKDLENYRYEYGYNLKKDNMSLNISKKEYDDVYKYISDEEVATLKYKPLKESIYYFKK